MMDCAAVACMYEQSQQETLPTRNIVVNERVGRTMKLAAVGGWVINEKKERCACIYSILQIICIRISGEFNRRSSKCISIISIHIAVGKHTVRK